RRRAEVGGHEPADPGLPHRERLAAEPAAGGRHAWNAFAGRGRRAGNRRRRRSRAASSRRSPGKKSRMRIGVIRNGMVGQRFLEQLAACGEFDITVFCEEPRPAYDRVQLTSFFSGRSAADLNLARKEFFAAAGVTLRLNDQVLSVDVERKLVRSAR